MTPGGPVPEKREHKFTLALTAQERHALDAAAARMGMPRATLAVRLVRLGIMGATAGETLPGTPEPAAALGRGNARTTTVGDGDGGQVAWLERGRGRPWRTWAWRAGEELRRRYPELARGGRLPEHWYRDDLTRDGLLALALWRMELDEGLHHDPRMELAWLRSLREFSAWLEQRAALVSDQPPPLREQPTEWIERGDAQARRLPIG